MNELNAFTNTDWDGYAGASNLPDGSPPQIGYIGDCVTIIVSGEGAPEFGTIVEVDLSIFPDTQATFQSAPMPQAMAMFVAENLTAAHCTPDCLKAMGFRSL